MSNSTPVSSNTPPPGGLDRRPSRAARRREKVTCVPGGLSNRSSRDAGHGSAGPPDAGHGALATAQDEPAPGQPVVLSRNCLGIGDALVVQVRAALLHRAP